MSFADLNGFNFIEATIAEYKPPKPYIDDKGMWIPVGNVYQLVIPKDLFVEAYNKWIKGEE